MSIDQARREFEASRKADLEARAILDRADEDKRDLTAEESAQADKWLDDAGARFARAGKLADNAKRADEVEVLLRGLVPSGSPEERDAVLKGDPQLVRMLSRHRDAFARGESAGELSYLSQLPNSFELRALADFSDGTKVYVNDFRSTVAVYMRTMSPWISSVTVMNAADGRPLTIPQLTADPTGYTPGEGTAITESSPTMGSATATPVSYKALSYLSQELSQDEMVDLLPYVAQAQGRSLALQAGSAFTASIIAAAGTAGSATVIGGFGTGAGAAGSWLGYEDLIELKYSLAVPYRITGAFYLATTAIKRAKKWKDGQGQYLWQPAIALGSQPTLDDSAVYEDPYLAAFASASKSTVFADPMSVVIKQLPLRVATSEQFKFDTDQVALKTVYRAAAAVVDTNGVKLMLSANS